MAWKKVKQSPFLPRAKDSPTEKAKRAMGTYNVFFESSSWPDSGHFKTDTQAASLIEFSTLISPVGEVTHSYSALAPSRSSATIFPHNLTTRDNERHNLWIDIFYLSANIPATPCAPRSTGEGSLGTMQIRGLDFGMSTNKGGCFCSVLFLSEWWGWYLLQFLCLVLVWVKV